MNAPVTLDTCSARGYLASVLAGVEGYGAWLSFRSGSKPVLVTGDDEFAGVCIPVRLPS